MWDKIKISPAFLLKNIFELQLKHNIIVYFCGDADNAEKMAEYILKKIYYTEKNNMKKISEDSSDET
jgi:hypothetical protein